VTNIFKRLDLIDTVPEELWMEFHDIVQETGIKTISKKKKCNKEKWLSEEALQIAEKRREAKGEGERKRYTYLNAEFQILKDNAVKVLYSITHQIWKTQQWLHGLYRVSFHSNP